MRRIGRSPFIVVVLSLGMGAIGYSPALAGEVLVNGDLEIGASPPNWSIETSITGIPGSTIPAVFEHNDSGNNPPGEGLGLLLHPQSGNQGLYAGTDSLSNFVLEQTFSAAVAGRTYTLQWDALFQNGYSGIVDTLEEYYPGGDYNENFRVDAADYTDWRDGMTAGAEEIPNRSGDSFGTLSEADFNFWRKNFGYKGHDATTVSQTETTFEMAFLDSSNAVIGTPMVYDVRVENPATLTWETHTLMDTAPGGTAKVRVRASLSDMQDNCCSLGQDVILDNFILHDNVATGLNRLTNGNLNTPGNPVGWTLTEGPSGLVNGMMVPADSAQFTFFANREIADTANLNPLPPPEFLDKFTGQQGLWLRPFVNTTQFDPDIPSVDAVLTQVVSATEGASYEFSAWAAWEVGYCDGLPGDTTADTFMKMEFLDGSMAVIGTEILHLAADGQVNDDLGGTEYDDWMQHFLNGVAPGGTTQVRVSLGATGMYDTGLGIPESAFFDEMSLIETLPGAGAGAASVAVPEPNSLMLLVVGLAFGTIGVRRRRSG